MRERDDLGFVHRYVPAPSGASAHGGASLLLLHGTGGDENDLLQLGRTLLPGVALLSPRGKVDEGGALRFFRRIREGVFDQQDLAIRTDELAEFITAASDAYGIRRDRMVAVGFSNGANIGASLLLLRPEVLRAGVLFRAMVPIVPEPMPSLSGTRVLISNGERDPIVSSSETERLTGLFRGAGAHVTLAWQPVGHELTQGDIAAAQGWIREIGDLATW